MHKDAPENQLTSIQINSPYIKELFFDNKNSSSSFVSENTAPKIEIAINFDNIHVEDNFYEVFLVVKVQANSNIRAYKFCDVVLSEEITKKAAIYKSISVN